MFPTNVGALEVVSGPSDPNAIAELASGTSSTCAGSDLSSSTTSSSSSRLSRVIEQLTLLKTVSGDGPSSVGGDTGKELETKANVAEDPISQHGVGNGTSSSQLRVEQVTKFLKTLKPPTTIEPPSMPANPNKQEDGNKYVMPSYVPCHMFQNNSFVVVFGFWMFLLFPLCF